jgi:hypothetical protein
MRSRIRLPIVIVGVVALMATGVPAGAEHQNRPSTKNLHPMGHIVEQRNLLAGDLNINTDIAFWGKYAFQGTWRGGFTVRDISAPGNPRTIAEVTDCDGPQGDVVVWDNVLVRTWDQPAGNAALLPPAFSQFGAGNECGGQTYPDGWEGIHIFDISDIRNPVLVGDVEFSLRAGAENFGCGSHTATGVPDEANNRLVIYSSPSNALCSGFDVIEIPLDDPGSAEYVRFAPSASPHVHCHDVGVILGDVMRAACAGGTGFAVWDLDPSDLTDPQPAYAKDVNEDIDDGGSVTIGHSAVFSWDGETIVFGHEPGGGVAPFCLETTPDSMKSAFFYDAETGELQSMWTLPRPQGPTENCTIHNYNMVPTRSGTNIMVGGHYLAGTWVVDFTDPANPRTVAWSDPPPEPVPDTPAGQAFGTSLCGAWSSYWYNGFIYETNICEGLNIFNLSGPEKAGAMRLPHLNPQTQEFSL